MNLDISELDSGGVERLHVSVWYPLMPRYLMLSKIHGTSVLPFLVYPLLFRGRRVRFAKDNFDFRCWSRIGCDAG